MLFSSSSHLPSLLSGERLHIETGGDCSVLSDVYRMGTMPAAHAEMSSKCHVLYSLHSVKDIANVKGMCSSFKHFRVLAVE